MSLRTPILLCLYLCLSVLICGEFVFAGGTLPDGAIAQLRGHRDAVEHLTFSADGRRLVSGNQGPWPLASYPLEAVTWDTATWKEVARSALPPGIPMTGTVNYSHDHRLGIVFDNGEFLVRDRTTGKDLRKLELRTEPKFLKRPASGTISSSVLRQMRGQSWGRYAAGGFFSPDDRRVVQMVPGALDWDLVVLDVASGRPLGRLPGTAAEIAFAFAPDGRAVAWYGKDATIQVSANLGIRQLGSPRANWDAKAPAVLAFAPNGLTLAAWEAGDNALVLWDLRTDKQQRRIAGAREVTYEGRRLSLAFSPDSKTLAVGGLDNEPQVRLYDPATGEPRRELAGHRAPVRALAFSADGRLLASGGDDTTIFVWKIE